MSIKKCKELFPGCMDVHVYMYINDIYGICVIFVKHKITRNPDFLRVTRIV